jgi:hypothetical protein
VFCTVKAKRHYVMKTMFYICGVTVQSTKRKVGVLLTCFNKVNDSFKYKCAIIHMLKGVEWLVVWLTACESQVSLRMLHHSQSTNIMSNNMYIYIYYNTWNYVKVASNTSPSTTQFEFYCRSVSLLQLRPITVHTLLLISSHFISSSTYLNPWRLTPGRSHWSLLELPTAIAHLTGVTCVLTPGSHHRQWLTVLPYTICLGQYCIHIIIFAPFKLHTGIQCVCVQLTTASSSFKNILNCMPHTNTILISKLN